MKNLIPEAHTFEYSLKLNIRNTNLILIKGSMQVIKTCQEFLIATQNKLEESSQDHKRLAGYTILKGQLDLLLKDFKSYQVLLLKFIQCFTNDCDLKLNEENRVNDLLDFSTYEEIKWNPQIRDIESQIMQFFQDSIFRNIKGAVKAKILPLFFTRGMITQQKIKELTHFSAGATSQVISELTRSKIIEASPIKRDNREKKHPRVYRVRSISMIFLSRIYLISDTIIQWERKFQEFQDSLQNECKTENHLPIYKNLFLYFNDVLSLVLIYKKSHQIITQLQVSSKN